MRVEEMFVRDITRTYHPVVTADIQDEVLLAQELEEYVVTKDLAKFIKTFYENYKYSIDNTTDKNGVWISGWFGSGKSHFLKMLAMLLENKEIKGKHALDYFIEDHKIEDNFVIGDMRAATQISSDIILFNIEAVSGAQHDTREEAIMKIFLSQFNKKLGYSDSFPYLADFERKLDEMGKYQIFCEKFVEKTGEEWSSARNDFAFCMDDFEDVITELGIMSRQAVDEWCQGFNNPYDLSIQKFAEMLKRYVDRKGNHHHVVFFVDEVGQYIGDNVQLMLGLQTLIECMGSICKGKVWIVLTSQQVLDDLTKTKGTDFSKISARFGIRFSLATADVDEVIQKRVLEKKKVAADTLVPIYENQSIALKNLLSFGGTKSWELYKDSKDFVKLYPFARYQFELLEKILQQIRIHCNSSKSISEGQRNMLDVCWQAVLKMKDKDDTAIIPLYYFYDAIEKHLDHEHKNVIMMAGKNPKINPGGAEDVFAINVLKTMFLIKYIEGFKSDLDGITTLMVDNIHTDRVALKAKVEEALEILVGQILVQKEPDRYEFLTDKESEVYHLIKNEIVDNAVIIDTLKGLIYDDSLKIKKYPVPKFGNRYAFDFSKKVDGSFYGNSNQTNALSVDVITPWYEGSRDILSFVDGIYVELPKDDELLNEMAEQAKIKNFLMKNSGNGQYVTVLAKVQEDMKAKTNQIKMLVNDALKKAKVFVNGNELQDSVNQDFNSKLNKALEIACNDKYNKLTLIEKPFNSSDLLQLLEDKDNALFEGEMANKAAAEEMRRQIEFVTKNHSKMVLNTLKNKFMSAPFGFVEDDINYLIGMLFKMGKINLTLDGINISYANKNGAEIADCISKKQNLMKLQLDIKEEIPSARINVVKNIYYDLLGANLLESNVEIIAQKFKDEFQTLYENMLKGWKSDDGVPYPGGEVFDLGDELNQLLKTLDSNAAFFAEVNKRQETFQDFAEDYADLKKFFGSEVQKKNFKDGYQCVKNYEENEIYFSDAKDLSAIVTKINEILDMSRPFGRIKELPDLVEKYNNVYNEIRTKYSRPVEDNIRNVYGRVVKKLQELTCGDEDKSFWQDKFDKLIKQVGECQNIATISGYEIQAKKLLKDFRDAIEIKYPAVAPDSQVAERKSCDARIQDFVKQNTWQLHSEDDLEKCMDELYKEIAKKFQEYDDVNVKF